MQYLLLFLEGVITFLSPCILPLLPIYISYFAAGEANRKKTLINSLGFVLGFTIIFVAMGAFAGTLGILVRQYAQVVNLIAGTIVILLGLNFMGALKIKFLNRTSKRTADTTNLGFFSSIAFGMIFSVGWTPCVGAFLGSALMMASLNGSTPQGMIMLFLFSLGFGLPFMISALLIDRLKTTFDFIKRNYKIINRLSGSLLVIVGILMASGLIGRFLALLTI